MLLGTIVVSPAHAAESQFVSRTGTQLWLNGQPFRFSGPNIYWLGLDEKAVGGVDYPTEFRIHDVLATAKEMGATVVRTHAAISVGCEKCIEPALGVFNETALQKLDYAIATAEQYGLKLVLPLVDNYHYYHGGKSTFTAWRGLADEEQFYTDPTVLADFRQYIATIVNRVNTYTGIAYKGDPTIVAWETGNELHPPFAWTQTIADELKRLDTNHLIIDGSYGIRDEALAIAHVDIYSDHFYPLDTARLANDAQRTSQANKAFVVGEYDWSNSGGGDALAGFLAATETNPAISGDLFWALWSHDDVQGYVTLDTSWDLHYPGSTPERQLRAQMLRAHAYAMRGVDAPLPAPPTAPRITSAAGAITWQGVAGADRYTIERSTIGQDGPWTVICDRCVDDYALSWTDSLRQVTLGRNPKAYRVMAPLMGLGRFTPNRVGVLQSTTATWYRMKAHNLADVAGDYSAVFYSTTVGFVDELNDWGRTANRSNNLFFDSSSTALFAGDRSRAFRNQSRTAEEIVWYAPNLRTFEATTYFWPFEPVSHFDILTSTNGLDYTLAMPTIQTTPSHWFQITYSLMNLANVNYVKIRWNNLAGQSWSPQIGRVRITADAN